MSQPLAVCEEGSVLSDSVSEMLGFCTVGIGKSICFLSAARGTSRLCQYLGGEGEGREEVRADLNISISLTGSVCTLNLASVW